MDEKQFSIANNERSSIQNIDSILEEYKNEMLQALKQEVIQNLARQNNGQASNPEDNNN
jgi:hypothetical protein